MKRIVLLSDGTGNSAAKRHKTNVWRLYEALDLSDPDEQIAFYDDGVGSQEFLPFKLLGGAFGWGLARNVLELYMALCRTYRNGDKIYLFGFSRGAFTIRMLAGLIAHYGLVNAKDERERRRRARQHFNAYRSRYKRGCLYRLAWRVRQWWQGPPKAESKKNNEPDIEFIGAWDTVDAYGFPVYGLVSLWDCLIWPLRFVDQKPSCNVRHACHALSIDDERASFWPLLWDEAPDCTAAKKDNGGKDEKPRIEQVWFAGVHADVGGGYPRNTLALVTLDWMISKVEHDLHFVSTIRNEYRDRANCHGVQHDSRSGLRAYYRYEPREIGKLCKDECMGPPKIHCSALERIQKGVVDYAPTALPTEYEVIDTQGTRKEYKKYDDTEMKDARACISWRRWLYAGFVLATLIFTSLPLFYGGSSGDGCDGWICLAGIPLELAACMLPECVMPWIQAWIDVVQNPYGAVAILVVVFTLGRLKSRWHSATLEHAVAAWAKLKEGD